MFFEKKGIERPLEQIKKEGFEKPESGEQGGAAIVSSKEGASLQERAAQMERLGLSREDLQKYLEEISKSDLERTIRANKKILLPENEMSARLKEALKPGMAEIGHAAMLLEGAIYPIYLKYVDTNKNVAFSAFDARGIRKFSGVISDVEKAVQEKKNVFWIQYILPEFRKILEGIGFEISLEHFEHLIGPDIQNYKRKQKKEEAARTIKSQFDF